MYLSYLVALLRVRCLTSTGSVLGFFAGTSFSPSSVSIAFSLNRQIIIVVMNTVPLETMEPFARKTLSLLNPVAMNSPRWD